jgi:membrane fusion protein (multidrug efflux system)/multidrug efflux system membrane fusion protein
MRRAGEALLLCVLAFGPAACSRSGTSESQPMKREMAFPVAVVRLEPTNVEYRINAVGSIEAFDHVQITARVGGAIERLLFQEGDTVKQGQLLAEIELRRYQLALNSAQASLARAEAARVEAEREHERAIKLNEEGVGTAAEVASWSTKIATSAAQAAEAKAAVGVAALNLREARVTAPISGTIETRSVETGQYVQPSTVLATLIQRDPLRLRFQVTETDAAALRESMVLEFGAKGGSQRYSARITHVGGAANEKTRMVPVLAEVLGDSSALRPGTFAEVRVPIRTEQDALVVPETAIRPSERGFLGFVVRGDVAEERKLELGLRTPEGLVQVKSGLSKGELLVIRGGEALKDKAKVKIAEQGGKPIASGSPG